MKTQNYLRKQAVIEHLVTPAAMHVLQNATANHVLLTTKGGIEIGKHLIGKNKTLGNAVHGVGRGAIPEKAILEDEVKHIIERIPNLSKRDRAVLFEISQGNFHKPFVVSHIQKSPALQKVLNEYGLGPVLNYVPRDKMKALSAIYKSNRLGRFSMGVGQVLRKTPLDKMYQVANTPKATKTLDYVTNGGILVGDAGTGVINLTKRVLAKDFSKYDNPAAKLHGKAKNWTTERFVKKPLEDGAELGVNGIRIPKIK